MSYSSMTGGRKKTQETMYASLKQRRCTTNKRAPTLVDKARELLKLSGVRTTLIINDQHDSKGGLHMYSNEDASMEDVLVGYLKHIRAKHPYHEIDHNNPQATFQATSGVKARKRCKVNEVSAKKAIVNLSTLPMSDSNDENTTNTIGDVDEIDDFLEDLEENTSVYRKGTLNL